MNILIFILFGALAGWIASLFAGTNWRQGLVMDIVLGVVGSLIGGLVMNFFGQQGVTGFNLYSLFVAVLGAVILLGIGRLFR